MLSTYLEKKMSNEKSASVLRSFPRDLVAFLQRVREAERSLELAFQELVFTDPTWEDFEPSAKKAAQILGFDTAVDHAPCCFVTHRTDEMIIRGMHPMSLLAYIEGVVDGAQMVIWLMKED